MMQSKKIAAKVLAMKHEFDFARDEDMNAVSKIKFCMVSQREWEEVRTLARALQRTKQ